MIIILKPLLIVHTRLLFKNETFKGFQHQSSCFMFEPEHCHYSQVVQPLAPSVCRQRLNPVLKVVS